MAYGFVYLLGNRAMPCYYKIGCTDRAPHNRARELSAASGVPHRFDVLLYIEVEDFQRVERRYHQEMADFRPNGSREFFLFGPAHMNWLWHAFNGYPGALSLAMPAWNKYAPVPQFPDEYSETWVEEGARLCMPSAAPIEAGDIHVVAD